MLLGFKMQPDSYRPITRPEVSCTPGSTFSHDAGFAASGATHYEYKDLDVMKTSNSYLNSINWIFIKALTLLACLLMSLPGGIWPIAAAQGEGYASVSGVAFLDSNGNGRREAIETTGIADLPISIQDASGSWVTIIPTGGDGSYRFDGMPAGVYTVTALILPSSGLVPTTPLAQQVTLVEGLETSDVDFGFLMTNAVYFEAAEAHRQSGSVLVSWSTTLEVGNDGFIVYRATDPAGPFSPINQNIIPPAGGGGGGADYAYQDSTVLTSVDYYYRVEAQPGLQQTDLLFVEGELVHLIFPWMRKN